MALNRRNAVKLAIGLLALLALLAAFDGWRLWRDERLNLQIGSGRLPAESANEVAEVRFARAHALAASGAAESALERYGQLLDDTPLGRAARYNSANLLLRQGIGLRGGTQPGQALASVELAKEGYREVLRQDAQDWAARYNLERAQRLLPDPQDGDEEAPDLKRNAERAATTMRGYSPGMP